MLVVRSCPFIAISYRSYFCSQFELPLLSVIPSLLVVIPSFLVVIPRLFVDNGE